MKKTTQLKDLRAMDTKALVKELADLNKKITELKFKGSFRRLKNFHEITMTKKKIARIWTVLSEKAMENYQKENQE